MPEEKEIQIEYTVTFVAKIKVPVDASRQNMIEAAGDIDIPEGGKNESVYSADSFNVNHVIDNSEVFTPEDVDDDD